jgi:tetratricopeptide (TPR) repeat protein
VLIGLVLTSVGYGQWDNERNLPGVSDDWVKITSPNFEVYSDYSPKRAREVLHDLEVLRAIFLKEMGVVEKNRVEVTVYAFGNKGDYYDYVAEEGNDRQNTAGLYLARPDRAIIVLKPISDREAARRVIFHEYVHHLFRAVGEEPPVWFNEGLAELLAGIKIKRKEVEIGHPVVDRLYYLQQESLMPLGDLFEVTHDSRYYNSDSHAGLFYAQSWALLHYWKYGNSKIPPEQVNRFMAVAGRKRALAQTNVQSLFEECFGMDYRKMEKQLARYVRRGRYTYGKVPLPVLPAPDSYPQGPVSEAEIRLRLAELAVRMRSDAVGLLVLMQAGESPDADPRIYETLGGDAMLHGDVEMAQQHWRRAHELGTNNSAVLRGLAREQWEKWFRNYVPTLKLPDEVAEEMRALLVASIRAEQVQDEAYQMLAWVEGFSTQPRPGNLNAVQNRVKQMDNKAPTLLALAMSRERMGHQDRAIEMLKQIGRFAPDDWTLAAAERTLAEWEGKEVSEVFLETERSAATKVGLERNRTAIPSVPVPEDLGEEENP